MAETLGWSVGASEAPVTVVEFTDPSCPRCASFYAGTRAALREEFVPSDQVRWITLTYVSGAFKNSEVVSTAAECAGRQGRYEAFFETAYRERGAWITEDAPGMWREVERFSAEIGLEKSEFRACRDDPSVTARLEAVRDLALRTGVRGTPTWFVDGFLVMGDLPLGYARDFIVDRLPESGAGR